MGCVLRGWNDDVVSVSEAAGWMEEFDCAEAKFVRIPNATHHVHEEEPGAIAEEMVSLIGLNSAKITVASPKAPSSPVKKQLPPPCPFVRGIDEAALQSFREGNLLYRMGSASGSKGEISDLPTTQSYKSVMDYPPRSDSESPN